MDTNNTAPAKETNMTTATQTPTNTDDAYSLFLCGTDGVWFYFTGGGRGYVGDHMRAATLPAKVSGPRGRLTSEEAAAL